MIQYDIPISKMTCSKEDSGRDNIFGFGAVDKQVEGKAIEGSQT
jgi:hypothetical protein